MAKSPRSTRQIQGDRDMTFEQAEMVIEGMKVINSLIIILIIVIFFK